jgi:predicted RNA-binding protein with PIN domain
MPYWFDGNNLIGQSAAAKNDSQTRRAFLSSLLAYRRSGSAKFLVYFDGEDPTGSPSPPGMVIRYSAPLSTDRAIVQRLGEIRNPSEVIVVTNDNGLKKRCRAEGANVLTWGEFVSKMKSKRISDTRRIALQEPVDVDEWIRYFGIENEE